MSRHQAIRNLDYQDELDDYEGYSDDENELSPEDRVLMKQGTTEVRSALGAEASKVTTAQIEESLWHYYYDVDKTVAYLISKFIDPPKKTSKVSQKNGMSYFSASKSVFALHPGPATSSTPVVEEALRRTRPTLFKTRTSLTVGQGGGYSQELGTPTTFGRTPEPRQSLSHYFRDMPWGNIPKERETIFIPPSIPRGGLLGGSGKMSKLQLLAIQRKKKAEEKAAQENKVDQTRAELASISLDDPAKDKENERPASRLAKRLRVSESIAQDSQPSPVTQPSPATESTLTKATPSEPALSEPSQHSTKDATIYPWIVPIEKRPCPNKAEPSAFARVLFASPSEKKKRKMEERIPLPWMEFAPEAIKVFDTPSPDDIVLAAQAKAGKKVAVNPPKKKVSSSETVAGDGNVGKVDDAPLPKSKNLDVLSEYHKSDSKKTASFVVVGHVDAGKSTMMGRLLLELGVVDQRTVDKLRQEAQKIGKTSFALAWVLDQRTEERDRGVTIDIATNRFETETTAFTILDAPGHRDFIPNMIAGASQADFAILVVDASTGAFESGLKGQTREHSLLIRSMGVSRIIVAVNKLDTVGWSKDRFDEIRNQVSGFLSATGFQAKNVSFMPVSGLHGDNLAKRSPNPAAGWYTGPTLIEELEKSEPNARALSKPLRMTISEVFRTPQSPVSITGRVDAGSLQMGDAILIQPSGEKAYIKSLLAGDAPSDWAVAGQTAVLHLSNIDPVHVRVGDIICDPSKPIQCLDTFTLKALAFDFLMPMQVDVHRGRLHAAGRIEVIAALLDKVTGSVTKKRPKIVKPASVARVVVKLESKVPLEAGQRVVLRSGGETVAAGLLE